LCVDDDDDDSDSEPDDEDDADSDGDLCFVLFGDVEEAMVELVTDENICLLLDAVDVMDALCASFIRTTDISIQR
jgi:hypothetical protein